MAECVRVAASFGRGCRHGYLVDAGRRGAGDRIRSGIRPPCSQDAGCQQQDRKRPVRRPRRRLHPGSRSNASALALLSRERGDTELDEVLCGAAVWIIRFAAPCPFGNDAGLKLQLASRGQT